VIVVDTPIWIDHLRRPDPDLAPLLANGQVLVHPFVIGELALGSIKDRLAVVGGLQLLPQPRLAFEAEILMFIERHQLHGSGIGYVDVHVLLSARLTDDGLLWTRDRRLHAAAMRLGIAWAPAGEV
jgi:predicted nucleic acid-binding protein